MEILLAQTDTTVGFLSQDAGALERIKGRPEGKPFLKVFADFSTLRRFIRVPPSHRIRVRHARKTTFVVASQAFRCVAGSDHARLVERYGWLYSTSANPSGGSYDPHYCAERADRIVEDSRGLCESSPSTILRLGRRRVQKLR